jgi:hypothetical protein
MPASLLQRAFLLGFREAQAKARLDLEELRARSRP